MSSVNGIYGKLLSWGVEESRWFKLCQQLLSAIALCFPTLYCQSMYFELVAAFIFLALILTRAIEYPRQPGFPKNVNGPKSLEILYLSHVRTRIGISMVRKITRTNRTRVIVVTFEDRWLPNSRGSSGGSSKQPHRTSPPSSQAPCSTWNKGRMYSWSQRLCGDLLVAKQKASTLLSCCQVLMLQRHCLSVFQTNHR